MILKSLFYSSPYNILADYEDHLATSPNFFTKDLGITSIVG